MTNKQNPESEESEAASLGIQKSERRNSSRGDGVSEDVLEAVNAPGKVFDAAEAARTNRHSGSAGGEQIYYCAVYEPVTEVAHVLQRAD